MTPKEPRERDDTRQIGVRFQRMRSRHAGPHGRELTYREIAQRAGVSESVVKDIAASRTTGETAHGLGRVAAALGSNIGELVGDESRRPSRAEIEDAIAGVATCVDGNMSIARDGVMMIINAYWAGRTQ